MYVSHSLRVAVEYVKSDGSIIFFSPPIADYPLQIVARTRHISGSLIIPNLRNGGATPLSCSCHFSPLRKSCYWQ